MGITKSSFWIRFDVINHSNGEIYLNIANCNLEKIDLYKIKNSITAIHSGSILPFNNREVKNNFYLFSLLTGAEKEKTTFYVRLQYERGLQFPIQIGELNSMMEAAHKSDFIHGIYFGFMIVMLIYNLILYFSIRDSSYLYYVFYVFSMGLLNAVINGYAFEYLWPNVPVFNKYGDIVSCIAGISGILFTTNFLNTSKYTPRTHRFLKLMFLSYLFIILLIFSGQFYLSGILMESITLILITLFFVTAIILFRKGYKPAKFFLIAWGFLLTSVVIFIIKDYNVLPNNSFTENSMQFGSAIEAALLSLALANRINIYKKEKEEAQHEYLKTLEANRLLIMDQNVILEQKVESRTHELKETQMHLMQQEKLASLGQLTAGIAHEIKNPLNFVNNFSDLSGELVEEIKSSKNESERNEILNHLKNNLFKISHHGKRADKIVDSMLLHSRNNLGEKQITDINKLCNDYFNVSFRGMQIKYPDFKCEMIIHLDETIPLVKVAPFDFGRVMLNLFNNSFDAVLEKVKKNENYNPVITLITSHDDNSIFIRVKDNGIGIPENIKEKIFNPFYTTKPAGKGTGLGLSLSYDIIIGHGGDIVLEKSTVEQTIFKISLPSV